MRNGNSSNYVGLAKIVMHQTANLTRGGARPPTDSKKLKLIIFIDF